MTGPGIRSLTSHSGLLLLLAAAGLVLAPHPGRAQPSPLKPVPPTPPALQQFNGALVGTIEEIRRETDFTGFVFRISRVEPAPGAPPVDGAEVAGAHVGLALAIGESGPLAASMLQSLDRFGPGHLVRAEVRAAGPRHLLYVRSMLELAPGSVPSPTVAPPSPPAAAPVGTAPNTARMAAELHSLRRDLVRLQREVAELRAMAQELEAQRGRR
jgi:hypothetical protein